MFRAVDSRVCSCRSRPSSSGRGDGDIATGGIHTVPNYLLFVLRVGVVVVSLQPLKATGGFSAAANAIDRRAADKLE